MLGVIRRLPPAVCISETYNSITVHHAFALPLAFYPEPANFPTRRLENGSTASRVEMLRLFFIPAEGYMSAHPMSGVTHLAKRVVFVGWYASDIQTLDYSRMYVNGMNITQPSLPFPSICSYVVL